MIEHTWEFDGIKDEYQEENASPRYQSYEEENIDHYNYIQQIKNKIERDWATEQIRHFSDLREQASCRTREPTPNKRTAQKYSIHPKHYHE